MQTKSNFRYRMQTMQLEDNITLITKQPAPFRVRHLLIYTMVAS